MPKKSKNNSIIFYGVDFHVHTPASTCYKSIEISEEEEYLAILRRYIEQGVKVIAITDHNTIKGYKKYLDIKLNLVNKLSVLNDFIDQHKVLKEQYKKIEDNLKLFYWY